MSNFYYTLKLNNVNKKVTIKVRDEYDVRVYFTKGGSRFGSLMKTYLDYQQASIKLIEQIKENELLNNLYILKRIKYELFNAMRYELSNKIKNEMDFINIVGLIEFFLIKHSKENYVENFFKGDYIFDILLEPKDELFKEIEKFMEIYTK